ncbi:restriction endonuclease subunit S [bacterium]|nr:restriction endonuclease subunit S [bacterium]
MTRVCLGDVANERKENCKTNEYNDHIVGLEHLIPQEVTLTQWAENIENTFTKVFHKGDILFGRRRAYLKKAAVAPFDGICSGDITVIEAKPNKIVPELLPFIIQNDNLFNYAVEKSAGSLSPRVKWSHLQNYEFELPDLNKQRELAELLWAAEETKQAYKKLLQTQSQLLKSKFIELFGDLSTNTSAKKVKISDVFELQMGKTPSRNNAKYWDSPKYRWISIADFNYFDDYTKDTKEYISEVAKNETGIKIVPKDTVIMTFKLTIGKTAITSENIYTNEAIMAFINKQKYEVKPYFVKELLNYIDWSSVTKQAVKGCTLNKNTIGNVLIPVPSIDKQNEYIEYAKSVKTTASKVQLSLNNLDKLTKTLLNQNLTKEVSHV